MRAILLFRSPVFVASLIFARLVFGLQSLILLSALFYGVAFLTLPWGRGTKPMWRTPRRYPTFRARRPSSP